jgi:hypothetical protein
MASSSFKLLNEQGEDFFFPDDPHEHITLRGEESEQIYEAILNNIVISSTSNEQKFKDAVS